MKQNRKSTKVNCFLLGLIVLGLLSSCGGSQPSYSVPQDSYDSSPQQYSSGGNPAPLVGHWRYTDILDSSIPLMTDYNVYFYADGTFERDEANESGVHSNYASGTWTATDTVIDLTFSNGEKISESYYFYGNTLTFGDSSWHYERVSP